MTRRKVARRKKTTKDSAPPKRGRKRLTQEAVAAEKARQAAGRSRRGLFWKPPTRNGNPVPFTQTMRFLPAFEFRGPEKEDIARPFFLIGQHWIQRENDEGETYGAGITCTNFIQDEHPRAWERYRAEKIEAVLEGEKCFFCELLEDLAEEDEDGELEYNPALPIGQWGDRPEWTRRYAHNFAILLDQKSYEDDDDQMVKVYPAPRSVKDGLYQFLDKKQFQDLFEDEGGWDVDVERFRKGKGPWNYSVTPVEQGPIWYENWEEELPDLEMLSPNWMTREEIVEWMTEAHPEVLKAFSGPVMRKRSRSGGSRRSQKSESDTSSGRRKSSTKRRSASSTSSSGTSRRPSRGSKKSAGRAKSVKKTRTAKGTSTSSKKTRKVARRKR